MQINSQIPKGFASDEEDDTDPYQVIADFFDLCSISRHRKHIYAWLEAVEREDHWRESCPSELLFYYKKLVTLIEAVHRICQKDRQRYTATDLLKERGYDKETDLLHPALYFGWGRHGSIWDYFPRHLTLEEYTDPYRVFPGFFELYDINEWYEELYELLFDALSSGGSSEVSDLDRDMLLIQKNLLKLVEAVHLIDVREVKCIGGFRKKYPFTLDRPCDDLSAAQILKTGPGRNNQDPEEEMDEEEDDDDEVYYSEEDDREYEENEEAEEDWDEEEGDDEDGDTAG